MTRLRAKRPTPPPTPGQQFRSEHDSGETDTCGGEYPVLNPSELRVMAVFGKRPPLKKFHNQKQTIVTQESSFVFLFFLKARSAF
jgi:hypothetical protein